MAVSRLQQQWNHMLYFNLNTRMLFELTYVLKFNYIVRAIKKPGTTEIEHVDSTKHSQANTQIQTYKTMVANVKCWECVDCVDLISLGL